MRVVYQTAARAIDTHLHTTLYYNILIAFLPVLTMKSDTQVVKPIFDFRKGVMTLQVFRCK